ncbi:gluconate 2-dehydrogenase subunit 3 family protein [Compostibacter hankyongensis]|uniref:Gluconate 2-dehydrogenase subunit 3 family protein n=1 Tax=Compostibacter hankyongensis TaxID=1007089 RepID=A0ABP8G123_9BACT
MDRRDAVKRVAILMGGALSASTLSVMLDSCSQAPKKGSGTQFTEDEKSMVDRMSDIIIPKTDTPGAKEAGVPAFIVMMMQECYPEKDQQQFHDGLAAFDSRCRKQYKKSFLELSPEKQTEALTQLDKDVLGKNKGQFKDLAFYRRLKELTLLGFFTSKPGATETLRYVQVPGHYDGCVDYHKGDKAWAT